MVSSTFSKSLACCIVALLAVSAPANTIFSASLNGASENPPPNEIIEGLLRDFEVGEALKRYGDGPERRRNLEGGQAYAKIHDATFSSDKMPLAFVFLIVGLVAGYSLRAAISQFRRAEARLRDHIDWDIGFRHVPTASSVNPPPSNGSNSRKSAKFQNYAN